MTKNKVVLCALILGLFSGVQAKAEAGSNFDNFYTVKETSAPSSSEADIHPFHAFEELTSDEFLPFAEVRAAVLSLLNFDHHQGAYGDVAEPYNRSNHFGGWIKDPSRKTCINTRGAVLLRDSSAQVSYSANGCTVLTGRWQDPYAGHTVTNALDLDIDHFVPLKNAYTSGADKWEFEKRCQYANYRGNKFHLLAVSSSENRRKGDRSPADYMPPNPAYTCQYLSQWLKVKLIWALEVSPPERDMLLQLAQSHHCTADFFQLSLQDLAEQRTVIQNQSGICH